MSVTLAVNTSIFLISIIMLFQLALALGAPWGYLAMGGKFPGKFPPVMRIAALIQMVVLFVIGGVIAVRGGVVFTEWLPLSESVIWGVVVFNVVGLVVNLATPSKWERIIWAPIIAVLLVCSLFLALA